MNIALWIVQGLLALMFLMAGFMKLSQSKEALKKKGMDWVDAVSAAGVRLIGLLELLAAFGLVLPWLTGILPILTPLAAVGLMLTMIGGATLHIRRKEFKNVGMNAVLFLLALVVAVGRW